MDQQSRKVKSFGTAPVFFTAISTIFGAILFLRFGYAVGTLGFWGVILIIITGHLVTIPTALALSEIATNQKVEGGGEYFIMSRSFGLNIGTTIGISLYLSQAISVAFYVIAFTEAFEPLFDFVNDRLGITLPRQVISLPAMLLLSYMILKRGANLGVKTLYIIVGILFLTIILFFLGNTEYANTNPPQFFNLSVYNFRDFFIVFAIVFPAFTGMTAGVGLSGDLRNPGKSIPLGTITATISGMIVYVFIARKLFISASPDELVADQLIMRNIAIFGPLIVPVGLAASTLSSAIGSIMVAPRTFQALARDKVFPLQRLNLWLAKGKGKTDEPFNSTIITCLVAFVFVALGNVNAVAKIISMFFMVTYGSLCLISFLFHFGADPSYRPVFRSRWYISLLGFLMCFWLMFKINTPYAIVAIVLLILIYSFISYYHKNRKGLEAIFSNAIFQLSRNIQIYIQKKKRQRVPDRWRPSIVCLSKDTFERQNALELLNWISYRYGFATYIHLIDGYYSKSTKDNAELAMNKLLSITEDKGSHVYMDTLISPSYTSAIAQIIQLPGISGMENNMMIFEFNKKNPEQLKQIVDNFSLARTANYDVCILGSSSKPIRFKNGIHIWIRQLDNYNANLMILLGYIITGHPDWYKSEIKIFEVSLDENTESTKESLIRLIQTGRLPITERNIEIIRPEEVTNMKNLINNRSSEAALTLIGFHSDQLKHSGIEIFTGYENIGDTLFVNARSKTIIE